MQINYHTNLESSPKLQRETHREDFLNKNFLSELKQFSLVWRGDVGQCLFVWRRWRRGLWWTWRWRNEKRRRGVELYQLELREHLRFDLSVAYLLINFGHSKGRRNDWKLWLVLRHSISSREGSVRVTGLFILVDSFCATEFRGWMSDTLLDTEFVSSRLFRCAWT
jgi:hypothetical protein